MKRKAILTGLFVVLMLVMTACSGAEPTSGSWNNNVFTSEYLGLRFVLPEGWLIATQAEISDITGMATALLDAADVDLPDNDMLYDFYVSSPITGTAVQLFYERLRQGRMPNPEQIMEQTAEQLRPVGGRVIPETGTTRIGNYDWHSFRSEITMQGATIQGRHFFNVQGRFVRMISISTVFDEWLIDNIDAMFVGLEGALPEPFNG